MTIILKSRVHLTGLWVNIRWFGSTEPHRWIGFLFRSLADVFSCYSLSLIYLLQGRETQLGS